MIKKIIFIFIYISLISETIQATQKSNKPIIVFDFGGVIATDIKPHMFAFLTQTFNINENELLIVLKDMQNQVWQGVPEEQFWRQYAASKGITISDDWFEQFALSIKNDLCEIPGTLEIVKELRTQGYQTAMLSNIFQCQAAIIKEIGYYDQFEPVLLSCHIGTNKPHAAAYIYLVQLLDIPASSIIFIDDKQKNIEAAKAQGIDAIQFINASQLKVELEKRNVQVH